MSISNTLANALSGLNVSARAADVVASNVANAMTEGYGTRRVEMAARVSVNAGSGVRVTGIQRQQDLALTGARRLAEATRAQDQLGASFLRDLEQLIGTPDRPDSLTARSAAFEAALVTAANTPHSQARLSAAVSAATALAQGVNQISDGIQDARLRADQSIEVAVTTMRSALEQLDILNGRLRATQNGTGEEAALIDAQERLLEDIVPLVPIQTRRDGAGALSIYTKGGATLLETRPAVLEFVASSAITPDMSVTDATLSRIRINGREIDTSAANNALAGGALAGHFAVRDDAAVAAQGQIDAVAFDLAQRLQDLPEDGTQPPGSAGVFTDAGQPVLSSPDVGLASRLRVNAALDPGRGGEVWRLRDGLGATAEGALGNAALLSAQVGALSVMQAPQAGGFSSALRSMASLVSDHLTGVAIARQSAETRVVHAESHFGALHQSELSKGVDTDAEMQRLLQIEKTYAANARVVQTAEALIDELMRIGR